MTEAVAAEKGEALVRVAMARAKASQGLRPMPLEKVLGLRSEMRALADVRDCLQDFMPGVLSGAEGLNNPALRSLLAGTELGQWSLSVDSINFLERMVSALEPAVVMEFGSGSSTLALQTFLQPLRESGREIRLFTVEQKREYMEDTRRQLSRAGLSKGAAFLHAPVGRRMVGGLPMDCCDLAGVAGFLGGARPELILVDGPLGIPGSRVTVLPEVLGFAAPKAVFLLDDAFRDGELLVAQAWNAHPGIHVDGVVWVGKGFLQGKVVG